MNNYQSIITQAANIVQSVAKKNFIALKEKNITQKKDGSFVTDIDNAIDADLHASLISLFPDIGFISEESQEDTSATAGLVWCIDPIDGTHNFMNDIPYYAVSVGLLHDGFPVAGILYDPIEDQIITGGKEVETSFNKFVLPADNNSKVVVTGRSHQDVDKQKEEVIVMALMKSPVLKYRRFGSCALDIMNMLRGRIGGVVVIGNSKWDWSAGYAIAQVFGYDITHVDDNHFVISAPGVTASLSVIK